MKPAEKSRRIDFSAIDAAYREILATGAGCIPIIPSPAKKQDRPSRFRVNRVAKIVTESVKHDGLGVTTERIVRKALKKARIGRK